MVSKKILLVSASALEVRELLKLKSNKLSENLYNISINNISVDILITGVGITAMTYHLTNYISNNTIDFAMLIGISGAYSDKLKLGDIVNVEYERFADLGIIDDNSFTDLFEMKLQKADDFPFKSKLLRNYTLINNNIVDNLPKVKANTVQSIRKSIILHIKENADVESMEGAAFFYVCLMSRIPFVQIRAISNYVGEQNKAKWGIDKSILNLNNKTLDILSEMAN